MHQKNEKICEYVEAKNSFYSLYFWVVKSLSLFINPKKFSYQDTTLRVHPINYVRELLEQSCNRDSSSPENASLVEILVDDFCLRYRTLTPEGNNCGKLKRKKEWHDYRDQWQTGIVSINVETYSDSNMLECLKRHQVVP